MKRFTSFFLLLIMLIALMAGCNPDPAPPGTTEATDSGGVVTTGETAVVTSTEEEIPTSEPVGTTEGIPVTEPTETNNSETPTNSEPSETGTIVTEPATEAPTEPKPTEPQPTEPKPTEPTNPPHTHSWSGWKQTKAPTCTTAGEETRTCGCGAKETRTINALGHNWGNWTQTQAPTCGAAGTETRSCSRCSLTETHTVAATGNHSWTETAPTCTANGSKTCKVCGASENIAALGHDWVHHDEEGHWQPILTCRCGAQFYTYDEWNSHSESFPREEWGNHSGFECHEYWIVDQSAYDVCSRCGTVK